MTLPQTDAVQAYTVSLLRCQNQYLMLQRSPNKLFAPMRWTGLGGHVEPGEYHTLRAAALREVQEESGIQPGEISDFSLRRVLLVSRPRQALGLLLYYTADIHSLVTPVCPEGILYWKHEADFPGLDIIETTRPVLNLLVKDMRDDPHGQGLPVTGLAVFSPQGAFQQIIWAVCPR